jgi:hypothetical protein
VNSRPSRLARNATYDRSCLKAGIRRAALRLVVEVEIAEHLAGGVADDEALSRDSPDGYRSGVSIRVLPAFLQDSGEVRTATSASGSPNGGREADLAIFPGILAHSSRRLLVNA